METTGTKISAVTSANPTDNGYVPWVDPSAPTLAGRAKRALWTAIATYVLGKREGLITEAEGLAGTEAGRRGISPALLKLIITGLVSGTQTNHKLDATAAPAATNDNTQGYSILSLWLWPAESRVWIAKSVGTNIAAWIELTGGSGGLDEAAVNALIEAALEGIEGGGLNEAAVNALIEAALEGIEDGGLNEAAVNALIEAALEEFEPGAALPVDDTTSLVKDPAAPTKQVRIDAGRVPADNTIELQAPPRSAVVGVMVRERQVSISGGAPAVLAFMATYSGWILGWSAYFLGTDGSMPIEIRLSQDGTPVGGTLTLNSGSGSWSGSGLAAGAYVDNAVSFSLGQVIGISIVNDGSAVGGSATGSAASGTLYVVLECTKTPIAE